MLFETMMRYAVLILLMIFRVCGVNTMHADALDPSVAKAPAGMILDV